MLFIHLFNLDYIFNFFFSPDNIEHCSWGLVVLFFVFFLRFCKHIIIEKNKNKKTASDAVKNGIMHNKELAEKLHKPIIRKSEKPKVHSFFMDIIWSAYLADM